MVDKEYLEELESFENNLDLFNQNFINVRKSPYFVDKTLLIKEVCGLTTCNGYFIRGSNKWGKSTVLSMISDFLGIYQEKPSPKVNPDENPRKILFKNTQITIVDSHSMFFPKHLTFLIT